MFLNILLAETLTTREIASLIWLAIFIFFLIFKKIISFKEIKDIFVSIFYKKILIVFMVLIIYTVIILFIVYKIQLWNLKFAKDFIVWFIIAGLPLCFSRAIVKKEYNFFRKTIKDNIKLVAVVLLIINNYTFNIYIELIIIPVVFIITILQVFSELDDRYKQFGEWPAIVLSIVVVVMIIHSIKEIVCNFNCSIFIYLLIDLFMPLLMSILYLPLAYLIGVYSVYDDIYSHINLLKVISEKEKLDRKKNIFKVFKLSYRKLMAFKNDYFKVVYLDSSKSKFKDVIENIKNND